MEDIVSASLSSNADDEHDPEGSTIAFEPAQWRPCSRKRNNI